ncbi:hypothetical protein HMPREF0758_0682 [Serratia odorifera DSM 4582]|uniref:Uncharacterized protein n=1 Tax=Serratia odorifera DSM 4582 TaxID=667129 RepID=D4DXN2_SEROD|nr:hypothetical protein HMPREF0758_0682 [Serratia odorifera DSM 4582]
MGNNNRQRKSINAWVFVSSCHYGDEIMLSGYFPAVCKNAIMIGSAEIKIV